MRHWRWGGRARIAQWEWLFAGVCIAWEKHRRANVGRAAGFGTGRGRARVPVFKLRDGERDMQE
eukprot:4931502-Pyramimonas_sp.AAC.1